MTRRGSGRRRAAAGTLGATLVATALTVGSGATAPAGAAAGELPAFAGCADLRSWYVEAALPLVGPWGLPRDAVPGAWGAASGPVVPLQAVAAAGRATATPDAARSDVPESDLGAAVGSSPTGTTVQEAGVDEPDLAKVDGDLLVVVDADGRRLRALDVSGDEPVPLGELALTGTPTGVVLADDRAVVLGVDELRTLDDPVPRPLATVTVVDLADPTAPRVVRSEAVDGRVVSAREHDGVVRVVTAHLPQLPPVEPPDLARLLDRGTSRDEQERRLAEATAAQRAAARATSAQDWLPQRLVRDAAGDVLGSAPLLDCAEVRHPVDPSGLGTLAVLTLDPAAPDPLVDATAVTTSGDLVYSSTERLYVATSRWRAGTTALDVAVADAVPAIAVPLATGTTVHAFDVSDPSGTSYAASGTVEGRLLSSWALDEHEGRLRVATTRDPGVGLPGPAGPRDPGRPTRPTRPLPSATAVVVLEERGDRLVEVGRVDGLGPGEEVKAVRWWDDVAVVVTFRRVDPLHVVDLSDPVAPRLRGELEVPGWSAHLHPVGGDVLLGVGYAATSRGLPTGVQASSYDLGDLDDPRRVDVEDLAPGGWTPVDGDARAMTYLPAARTAVVTVHDDRGRDELVALRVGLEGALGVEGRWSAQARGTLRRAVPLPGDPLAPPRLAVVTDGAVVLLALEGMRELGRTGG